jgi:prepilin-type N-terminal cleavage/methylation domain-containing protein
MRRVATPDREVERDRVDAGFSLIEVVIAVALLSIVVLPVLETVISAIGASTWNRSAAQVETVIVNAADRVNRAPKRCDYTIYAQAAVQTQGWAPAQAVVTHEFYRPAADPSLPGSWEVGPPGGPGCDGGVASDLLVQRVTITISSPDRAIARTIQVVKSDV